MDDAPRGRARSPLTPVLLRLGAGIAALLAGLTMLFGVGGSLVPLPDRASAAVLVGASLVLLAVANLVPERWWFY